MNKERLTGRKVVAAAGVLFMAEALAACSGNNTPAVTEKPTLTPTEKPTPSLMASPSLAPEVTPSPVITIAPTPEATPTPTPEATPMPIASLIEGKHPKVAASKITTDINNAFANNPQAEGYNDNTLADFKRIWKICQNGDSSSQGDPLAAKFNMCETLVANFYLNYQGLKDINFYNAAKNAYNYTYNKFPDYRADLDSQLKQIFK